MAITYTWKVTGLKTRNEGQFDNAVVQTYWTKTGTDENGNEGSFQGATPFSTNGMPDGQTFVPFEQLTEEAVLNWIKAVVVGQYEQHVNGVIEKQIAEKSRPIVEAQMPWAPPAEAAPTTPPPAA
jgi:hypothetical protein